VKSAPRAYGWWLVRCAPARGQANSLLGLLAKSTDEQGRTKPCSCHVYVVTLELLRLLSSCNRELGEPIFW
jgi:hypothetical protein